MEIRRGLVPSAGTTTDVDSNLISTSTFDQQAMPSTALSCHIALWNCVVCLRIVQEERRTKVEQTGRSKVEAEWQRCAACMTIRPSSVGLFELRAGFIAAFCFIASWLY